MVTDEFWRRVEPLIPQRVLPDKAYVRKPGAGRPPKRGSTVFEGIVYVLRTGCQWKPSARTDGSGKKRSKRHLLVDGRGVPLSLVVTAANVNDGKRLDEVLSAIVIKRKLTPLRSKHLCADAGSRSADNLP